ncbi:chlorophyllase/cutinase-like alpha/beta fold protein [Amycolatopsis anabasis]|uniref:poly(ethylene terephthalate) hydrolase family protein n=1 Tax=Amycolatopsis anabasis TaxID=1840409 RepID=UPI00131BB8FB|nr:acetylxylan esterase [Amycolatopsis anabasis]
MQPRARLWSLFLVLITGFALVAAPPAAAATGFPPVGGRWAEPGPFPVAVEALDADHTVYRPATLGQNGLRHPVIVWGNGTFATPPVYDGLLRHWASHGFIVAAANTAWSGSGQEMLAGATALAWENDLEGSPYFRKVDLAHIGASGHSQGGGGTIAAGADPRITTTVPIQPGPQGSVKALRGPMFILAGQRDLIVFPPLLVIPRYRQATQIPAIYGELAGATHGTPTGDGGGYRGATTAWFRFWLMGDQQARGEFFGPACRLCDDPAWSSFQRNPRAEAIRAPALS